MPLLLIVAGKGRVLKALTRLLCADVGLAEALLAADREDGDAPFLALAVWAANPSEANQG